LISVLTGCSESSILLDCAWNIFICQSWSSHPPYSGPAFPSFHPLRSQGGHNGGFQRPFCLTSMWGTNNVGIFWSETKQASNTVTLLIFVSALFSASAEPPWTLQPLNHFFFLFFKLY
jgi:hypothetical protein